MDYLSSVSTASVRTLLESPLGGPHRAATAELALRGMSGMSMAEVDHWPWLLVRSFVSGCSVCRTLLPSFPSFIPRVLQESEGQESQMKAAIWDMKQELSPLSTCWRKSPDMPGWKERSARGDQLNSRVKAGAAQLRKLKWVVSVVFYTLQAARMVCLIWKYYSPYGHWYQVNG